MNRRIVFKCSFGGNNGWGHLVRCSALAHEFKARDWDTILWSDSDLSGLPSDVTFSFSGSISEKGASADILLIDEMYTSQSAMEEIAGDWKSFNSSGIVAGIDDMQRRCMSGFDLVLNTEIGLSRATYAAGQSLLGESYALLRSGFQNPVDLGDLHEFEGSIPVLVMVGGTDAFGYLPRVLDALSRLEEFAVAPVVVGAGERDLSEELEAFACSRVIKCIGSADLAAWMQFCRIGIIGCGSSLYEAAAMKLPFIGLSIVDNQTATARKVTDHWGMPILHLEDKQESSLELKESFSSLIGRKETTYSKVDTWGASRVADALEVLCVQRASG